MHGIFVHFRVFCGYSSLLVIRLSDSILGGRVDLDEPAVPTGRKVA